jgi:hypothetical protein
VRSVVCWLVCGLLVDIGSGSNALPCRNPRLTLPSGLMPPLPSASLGGDARSESGEPMELLATSRPDAWPICAAGTTRFRRLMTDFFMVTGRCTPCNLWYNPIVGVSRWRRGCFRI